MRAQSPVGVIPASKTVSRTIEVAVLRGTLENCTLDSMRRANLHKVSQLEFSPLIPDKQVGGNNSEAICANGAVCFPVAVAVASSSQLQQSQPSPSPPSS